jgi:hypothetical protein
VAIDSTKSVKEGDAANPTVENGMIHAISSIIDVIVSSAGEYGAASIVVQQGI